MSTLAESDPALAIRNAMERLRRRAEGTPIEDDVRAEGVIVEEALQVLSPESDSGEALRRCRECGFTYGADDEEPCPRCDLFGARGSDE